MIAPDPDRPVDDPREEFVRLLKDYRWDEGELDRLGRRCGLTGRHFRQLVALMREAVIKAGFVPDE